ncbi:hypothetical protein GIX45_06535 [Erwinia sp. CPCC 100877]|nr:hypothetical protein [Erwinia sp. CPCC 100877]
MKRIKKINILTKNFTDEKKFMKDGYYRLKTIDETTIEFAFLIAGPCGETLVHPQITVSLNHKQEEAIGIKLIDLHASPPRFLTRDAANEEEIDAALDELIERFWNRNKEKE